MIKEQTQNHAWGFKLLASADISSMETCSWHAFLFGNMVDNVPRMGTQLAIFLQRGRWQFSFRGMQAIVLPLEREDSAIEMQPVIFTTQKTHPTILPNERNGQQFSHGE